MPIPLNRPTLLAWMALDFEPETEDQQSVREAWQGALNDPDVDVNAQFKGNTLLTRVLAQTGPKGQDKRAWAPEDLGFQAAPHEQITLNLLARGADPWVRTTEEKDQPPWRVLKMALEQEAWAIVQAVLTHPNCPPLNTLLQATYRAGLVEPDRCLHENLYRWPGAIQALVLDGLDPNAKDRQGTPLIFQARSVAMAEWLVRQGADLFATDSEGCGLLTHLEKVTDMGTEQRMPWIHLMGQKGISDDHIVRMGLSGYSGKMTVLFSSHADRLAWRHRPVNFDRDINALDLAIVATVSKTKAKLDAPGAEQARLLLSDPQAQWPQRTRDLASVLYSMADSANNCQRLLRGIEEFVKLSGALVDKGVGDNERFGDWLAATRETSERANLAQHWVTWLQARPQRWLLPQSTGLTEPAKHWLRSWSGMPPRVEVAACGFRLLAGGENGEDFEVVGTRLSNALGRLNTDLDAPEWRGLCDSVAASPQGPAFQALRRAWRAQSGKTPGLPQAGRPRPRP